MTYIVRLPKRFGDYLASIVALCLFVGVAGWGLGISMGYRMGERETARALEPEIQANADEMATLADRLIFLTDALSFQGVASWYGDKEHGRIGANNKRFDMFARTIATKFLPFNGLRWRVTCLETGATTVVESTDDGPNVPGRAFDLSYQAAVDLGLIERGLTRVLITPEL